MGVSVQKESDLSDSAWHSGVSSIYTQDEHEGSQIELKKQVWSREYFLKCLEMLPKYHSCCFWCAVNTGYIMYSPKSVAPPSCSCKKHGYCQHQIFYWETSLCLESTKMISDLICNILEDVYVCEMFEIESG